MANKSYRKGYQFERQIFHLFQSAGYYVIRSAGSHGCFDIIAIKNAMAFGIQCKYNNHITPAEKMAMINAYQQFGIIPLYAHRTKGKPLIIKCLLNDEVIKPEELYNLPEKYKAKLLKHFIELNGKG